MYATCLFCHSALGANESIEHFPIGTQLAYDAAKGRLWVVCSKCDRWNLSPLEERWEAIEDAERAYRDTRKRMATENIGLARLPDGTELIRIGKPLRPEFAAWRYGDRFGKRRSKQLVVGGALVGSAGALSLLGLSALVAGSLTGLGGLIAVPLLTSLWRVLPVVSVRDDNGTLHRLSREQVGMAAVRTHWIESNVELRFLSSRWDDTKSQHAREIARRLFRVRYPDPNEDEDALVIRGSVAMLALSTMLPALNSAGASERRLSNALALIEHTPSAAMLMVDARQIPNGRLIHHKLEDGITMRAGNIPATTRLALEMSLHEADERRAMDGELRELEQRWKEAEEIANISDSLMLPAGMNDNLEAIRRKSAYVSDRQFPDSGR